MMGASRLAGSSGIGTVLCLAVMTCAPDLHAQVAVLDEAFSVDTARGDRSVVEFTVQRQGRIRVQAAWTGSARNLALILNGPGQTGYYARQDGASPLVVAFNVGEREMRRGRNWRISIVNFRGGKASGHILIEYPGPLRLVEHPELPRPRRPMVQRAEAIPPAEESQTASAEPERTFLEDGTVEVRYPDGRIRRQRVGECGYTTIMPDGTESIFQCAEVQKEEIPELPSDLLARQDLGAVLEAVADDLLNSIRQAVEDESAVANYLTLEEGKNLQERIFLRLKALSALVH